MVPETEAHVTAIRLAVAINATHDINEHAEQTRMLSDSQYTMVKRVIRTCILSPL